MSILWQNKSVKSLFLFWVTIGIPTILMAQSTIEETLTQNSSLVESFALLTPTALSPFWTIFITSLASSFGIGGEFIATNPLLQSKVVLLVSGLLVLITSIPNLLKVSKPIGLAATFLEDKSGIIISIIMMVAPYTMNSDNSMHSEMSFLGISNVPIHIIALMVLAIPYYMTIVTLRFFLEVLIFLSPIPFLDAVFEFIKKAITFSLITIYFLFPTTGIILSILIFVIALFFLKKAKRFILFFKYIFLQPLVIKIFRKNQTLTSEKIPNQINKKFVNPSLAIQCLTDIEIGRIKNRRIVWLIKEQDKIFIGQPKSLLPPIIIELENTSNSNFQIVKKLNHFLIQNDQTKIKLLLNNSYKKLQGEILTQLNSNSGELTTPVSDNSTQIKQEKNITEYVHTAQSLIKIPHLTTNISSPKIMQMKVSSVTDKPISTKQEDLLESKKYAEALSKFISESDTPLTIGLQGEWGTGKTSMMYMLQEILDGYGNVATSWVNTWEYSMFRGASETTPAVLKGMLEKLKDFCLEKGTWTKSDERIQKIQKIGRFIGNLANQVIRNQSGLDLQEAANGNSEEERISSEISYIKNQIKEVIEDLINDSKNEYKRVVFFVDDLDRIPPTDAVEVLEALKNMFDIPNCIFILAIDYEVVIKGLEGKFGKKTEENEREFRSFFDKIIQVPFSMPTGTYDIKKLLVEKMKNMGIEIPEGQDDAFSEIVKYTVGYNPRSLKRFMNSFSLLRSLRALDLSNTIENNQDAGSQEENDESTEYDDLVLFAILGIQISYNKIFRIISQSPQFWDWGVEEANRFQINLEEVEQTVKSFGDNMKDKTDEYWEKIIYGICHRKLSNGKVDPYLSSRWEQIINLQNLLAKKILGSDFKSARNIEVFEVAWNNALSLAAITAVDDDPGVKSKSSGRKHVQFDSLTEKEANLREEGVSEKFLKIWKDVAEGFNIIPNTFYKLNGSNIVLKTNNNQKILTLHNPNKPRRKNDALGFYIYHKKGIARPRFNIDIYDFNPPKLDSFKLLVTDKSQIDEVFEVIEWAKSSYDQ